MNISSGVIGLVEGNEAAVPQLRDPHNATANSAGLVEGTRHDGHERETLRAGQVVQLPRLVPHAARSSPRAPTTSDEVTDGEVAGIRPIGTGPDRQKITQGNFEVNGCSVSGIIVDVNVAIVASVLSRTPDRVGISDRGGVRCGRGGVRTGVVLIGGEKGEEVGDAGKEDGFVRWNGVVAVVIVVVHVDVDYCVGMVCCGVGGNPAVGRLVGHDKYLVARIVSTLLAIRWLHVLQRPHQKVISRKTQIPHAACASSFPTWLFLPRIKISMPQIGLGVRNETLDNQLTNWMNSAVSSIPVGHTAISSDCDCSITSSSWFSCS